MRPIPYGRQDIDEADIEAVLEALRSDWLTQGPAVGAFETALSGKLGAEYACVVSSGTAALHLLGLAMGWQSGDIVITSPLTFVADANCIVYAGATPDLVDIDPDSYTLDPCKLEDRIQTHQKQGRRVRAVIGVDYAGHPCDWKALRSLADKYGFQLVADACHALGATLNDDPHYAARYADAAVLSFHPVKHITTGEGGAVITGDTDLAEKVKLLRTHGITKDPKYLEKNDGPWYYEMHALGFNYRITDIQCALGMTQLKKLDRFVARRRCIARYYDEVFGPDDRFTTPTIAPHVGHAYHLYPLQVHFDSLSLARAELFERLKEKDILLQVHYIPVHLQPYYRKHYGFNEGEFPVAEQFYRRVISIPMHPRLDDEDLNYISASVQEAVS